MRRRVLIDANLLVLLAVGSTDKSLISRHKRSRKFTPKDFDLLVSMLSVASEILLTPHALAEASNLVCNTDPPTKAQILAKLKFIIDNYLEIYTESKVAAEEQIYYRLGLTDAMLLNFARKGIVILTDDLDLYLAAHAAGCEAINFTYSMEANR